VPHPFFPDTAFAWVFCGALILLTGVAAWIDTRKARVPNRLTVTILVLGLVANMVRGGLLGAENKPVLWSIEASGAALGVLYGFLFALVGFVVIFAIMFGFWIFGLCGGGDVKLFAATAAWLSLPNFLIVWFVTLAVLFVWMLGQILLGGLRPRQVKKSLAKMSGGPNKDRATDQAPTGKRGKMKTTFSFPLAVATTIVVLWLFRVELQLVQPKPQQDQQQGTTAHVRPSPLPA
jgi:Flp pilus assembly protein protease CpaA